MTDVIKINREFIKIQDALKKKFGKDLEFEDNECEEAFNCIQEIYRKLVGGERPLVKITNGKNVVNSNELPGLAKDEKLEFDSEIDYFAEISPIIENRGRNRGIVNASSNNDASRVPVTSRAHFVPTELVIAGTGPQVPVEASNRSENLNVNLNRLPSKSDSMGSTQEDTNSVEELGRNVLDIVSKFEALSKSGKRDCNK